MCAKHEKQQARREHIDKTLRSYVGQQYNKDDQVLFEQVEAGWSRQAPRRRCRRDWCTVLRGAEWPLTGGAFTTPGVHALWPKRLAKLLTDAEGTVHVAAARENFAAHFKSA
jgi:hypothetical protein